MDVTINPTKRQSQAWKYLNDDTTNIVLFGGSAGGGKSWLGCLWITTLCLQYKGIRCLIGRSVLTQLKLTTLNTLFDLLSTMGLKSGEHFTFNGQSNVLTFYNKSEIIFKDLAYNPSDPNYDSLGSLEVSACFIDEASQITSLAFSIVKSRIRYKLNEFNLIPKILLTLNPSNNWIKKDFYLPHTQGTLESNKVFIPSLPMDNPHLPPSYIEMLKELPPQQRRRLLEGDWDYLEESDSLFKFDDISNSVFRLEPNPTEKKVLTLDVARFGDDRSVAFVWIGLVVVSCHVYRKLSTTELYTEIHSNLKSQCYVKLSDMFREGKISLNILEPSIIEDLTQELLAVKLKDIDKDNKVAVQSKDEMKRTLGKSPDLSDSLMMRMMTEIKSQKSTGRYMIARV